MWPQSSPDHNPIENLWRILKQKIYEGGRQFTSKQQWEALLTSCKEDLVNIEMFLTAKEVEESLERQETATCLAWCHDNKSRLRKMKSCLEFSLRIQEFIELIRQNKRMDARSSQVKGTATLRMGLLQARLCGHARKHFSQAEGGQLDEVRQVMGMLAFPSDTHISPYKDLLDPARWKMLIQQFRYDNYRLHQLGNNSVFTITLQAGLSAIKTPQCYKEDGTSKNPDCPVCSKSLNKLAQPLPMAHCANSRLVCKISGEVMNENNPPMMLPNGYVYGYNSLLSIRQDDKVVCPRTKEVFSFSQAEKVYIIGTFLGACVRDAHARPDPVRPDSVMAHGGTTAWVQGAAVTTPSFLSTKSQNHDNACPPPLSHPPHLQTTPTPSI
ncbi:hypothetical protein JZ751_025600 [Albula glossodonta]|uniref:Macrophage erythroblast attacher n=1 Tax=Albula glossodonta TaxID=121402 RepID=A0A8T2NEX6_9TELE|nr:hypothetical protein JZ751_025600 [Albula glossodonta]